MVDELIALIKDPISSKPEVLNKVANVSLDMFTSNEQKIAFLRICKSHKYQPPQQLYNQITDSLFLPQLSFKECVYYYPVATPEI